MVGSELLYFSDNSGCMWHIIHLQKKNVYNLSLYMVYKKFVYFGVCDGLKKSCKFILGPKELR